MNHIRFAGLLSSAILAFFLTSCGGSGNEKTTANDSTTADTTSKTPPPPPSTIITQPQNMVVVTQKVRDYAKWKIVYDADDSARLASGAHNYVIGRGTQDSNLVLVALKIDDTAKAKAFVKNPHLKMAMKKGGVVGAPMISFITETWQDTATLDSKIRSRTTFSVKDWDVFLKAFEDGKQERTDNGITDRVIGHDLNDNKKVVLVTAVTDTAKASAYYKSDALKKRREGAGVMGTPDRFLFRIVQRY
ncbi:MAG: hypothetical protein Q8918_15780 [Bacteroidota bacterium]|nr:hypothetical protein [Bacteroidota bacterium]